MNSFDDIFLTSGRQRIRLLVRKSRPKPPPGYTAIINSKHGGFHKQIGGRWSTWYPDTGVDPHHQERFEHLVNHVGDHSESRTIAHHGDGTRTEVITRDHGSGQLSQHVVRWHADGSHTVYPATKVTHPHIDGLPHVTVHHVDGTKTTEPIQDAPYREQKVFTRHLLNDGGKSQHRIAVLGEDGRSSERDESEEPQLVAVTYHVDGTKTAHGSEDHHPPEMARHYTKIRERAKGHWAIPDDDLSRSRGDYATNVKPHDNRVASEAEKLAGPSDTVASLEEQGAARRAAKKARTKLANAMGTPRQASAEHAYNLAEARASVAVHGARGALLHHTDEAHHAAVFHDWETKAHETQAAYILAAHPELRSYHDAMHERNYAKARHAEKHGLLGRKAADVDAAHQRIKDDAESLRAEAQAKGPSLWEKIKTKTAGFLDGADGMGEFDEILAKAGKLIQKGASSMNEFNKIFDLSKAGGPYIGPKGGKWADPQHTISWDDKQHGHKAGSAKPAHLHAKTKKLAEAAADVAAIDADTFNAHVGDGSGPTPDLTDAQREQARVWSDNDARRMTGRALTDTTMDARTDRMLKEAEELCVKARAACNGCPNDALVDAAIASRAEVHDASRRVRVACGNIDRAVRDGEFKFLAAEAADAAREIEAVRTHSGVLVRLIAAMATPAS